MKLLDKANIKNIGQADPFIFESNDKFYIYTTGDDGIYAYYADDLFGEWHYHGMVFTREGNDCFWAPSVIELDGKYYMYCSFEFYDDIPDKGGHRQTMFVSVADNPLGPFTNEKQLLHPFSIDSHVVKNESGLFIFYSTNTFEGDRIGTYIVVDRLLDPYTVQGKPHTVVVPTLDEDIFRYDRYKQDQHWHTIEGAFYFKEGDWQYVMYSGNCYEKPTYYIGYARAKTDEADLTKIDFEKFPDDNTYSPVMAKNEFEEGTGHHSIIKYKGEYYAVYHARDLDDNRENVDRRTARICKLIVKDGIITAEPHYDHI